MPIECLKNVCSLKYIKKYISHWRSQTCMPPECQKGPIGVLPECQKSLLRECHKHLWPLNVRKMCFPMNVCATNVTKMCAPQVTTICAPTCHKDLWPHRSQKCVPPQVTKMCSRTGHKNLCPHTSQKSVPQMSQREVNPLNITNCVKLEFHTNICTISVTNMCPPYKMCA